MKLHKLSAVLILVVSFHVSHCDIKSIFDQRILFAENTANNSQ